MRLVSCFGVTVTYLLHSLFFIALQGDNKLQVWHRRKPNNVKISPWDISVLGRGFKFEPTVNGICLMAGNPLGGDVYCIQGCNRLCHFLLLGSAQHSACVSKWFLTWIKQWQWVTGVTPLLLISLPQALRGLLFDVLVPCMHDIHSAVVKEIAMPSFQFL